jgi:hypothetical protein
MRSREKEAVVIRNLTRRWVVVLLVVVASLAAPVAGAYGQTPANSQYSGNLGQTAHGGTAPVVRSGGSSTLPFTGLDLGGVAGAGLALMGAGLVLRRRAQHTA